MSGTSELLATRLCRFLDRSTVAHAFPFWPGRVAFLGSGEAWSSGHDSFPPYSVLFPNSKAPWLTKKGD